MEHDSQLRESNCSNTSILWNDFESSRSSAFRPESPEVSMPLPNYQSTPLAVRSPGVRSTMMSDFISPVAKRRKLCSLDGSLASRGGDDSYATELSFTFVDLDSDSEASLSVSTQQFSHSPDENRSSQLSNASAQLLGLSCCDGRCLAKFSLLEVECCRTLPKPHLL